MSTVLFMRFNKNQGALIADESTWHLSFKYGYRRTNYGDSILNLFEKENNIAAVYAGTGFPSFHYEVARKTRNILKKDNSKYKTIEDISNIIFPIYQEVHERYINDKLKMMFGFTRDELNALSFERNGKKYEIKQDILIQEAKKYLKFQNKSDSAIRIFENSGIIMGYDPEYGINGYWLEHQQKAIDFASHLGVIGEGSTIANKVFSETINKMHLSERRKGFNLLDGLFILIKAAIETKKVQCGMGGNFQLFLIDHNHTKEILNNNIHLASEVVQAYLWGFIDLKNTYGFIENLLINDADFLEMEEKLFTSTNQSDTLKKYLMGYKPVNTGDRINN